MHAAITIAVALVAGSGTDHKIVDFVGFSKDESAAAWRVAIERHQANGAVDSFTLIHLVAVETNQPLATFRGSPIQRTRDGRRVRARARRLEGDNPDYEGAATLADWKRVKRKGRFAFKPLKIDDATLRFLPDEDLDMEMERTRESLNALGQVGEPVGYRPMVRTLGGDHVSLGHVREAGQPGTRIEAAVLAFHSKTGLTIAVLNRFSTTGDDTPSWSTRILALHEPVGTTDIGAMRLALSSLQLAERDYLANGEKFSDLYTQYVGSRW